MNWLITKLYAIREMKLNGIGLKISQLWKIGHLKSIKTYKISLNKKILKYGTY